MCCCLYEQEYDIEVYPASRDYLTSYVLSCINGPSLKFLKPIMIKFRRELIIDDSASKEALAKIIDILPGHVYWLDKEGKILGCNKTMAKNLDFGISKFFVNKYSRDLNKRINKIRGEKQKIIRNRRRSSIPFI